jgi:hypothetical protein
MPAVRREKRLALKAKGLCVDECGRAAVPGKVSCDICIVKGVAVNKRTRETRKAAGLCTYCGKRPAVVGKVRCIDCFKINHDQRGGLGLCRSGCGEPRAPGKATCQSCLDNQRKKNNELKAKGLCVNYCGRKAVPGKTKCRVCQIKAAYRNAIHYAERGGYKPFAMSMEDFIVWFLSRFESANGLCEWCGTFFGDSPVVDHDHVTGEVRALVCRQCNVVEGHGIERLRKVLAIMETWQRKV